MPYASNGDTKIFFESGGKGTPLILLMGLGGSVRAWALQWPAFTRAHRVVAMDTRGAGRSDKPEKGYSVEIFAQDLATVMDHAGIASAHILGLSLGGLIAQDFYHAYPQRVRSLTLCATGVGVNDAEGVPPEKEVIDVLSLDPATTPRRKLLEQHVKTFYHSDYQARIPNLVDKLEAFQALEPPSAHGYQGQLHAIITHKPHSHRLQRIKVPTLILHGEDDRVWPPENGRCLAAGIPGAQLREIPRAAHMLPLEKPDEFNQAVLTFLHAVETGNWHVAPKEH